MRFKRLYFIKGAVKPISNFDKQARMQLLAKFKKIVYIWVQSHLQFKRALNLMHRILKKAISKTKWPVKMFISHSKYTCRGKNTGLAFLPMLREFIQVLFYYLNVSTISSDEQFTQSGKSILAISSLSSQPFWYIG